MKVQLILVPGLSQSLAIRPDLSRNISNIIEQGSFAPLFPCFPALPGPFHATVRTGSWPQEHGIVGAESRPDLPATPVDEEIFLEGFYELSVRRGPGAPQLTSRFRELDEQIGQLVQRGRTNGMETVLAGSGAVLPVKGSIDLEDILRKNDCLGGVGLRTEGQISHIDAAAGMRARIARTLDEANRGIRALFSSSEKAGYHVDHHNCGDIVAISPPNRFFMSRGRECYGACGHLPPMSEAYGVFISSRPVPGLDRERHVLAVDVLRLIKEMLS